MASPKAKPSRINQNGYVEAVGGTVAITSIVRPTFLRFNGNNNIPVELKPQEFFSPIQCTSFRADPFSVTYIIHGGTAIESDLTEGLTASASAGETEIFVADQDVFSIGDIIIIDEGTAQE